MSLAELHRPKTWQEVIGQDKAVSTLQRIARAGGWGGKAYWIAGSSGTGKSSIGRLIAAELAESWHTDEMDAAELTADKMREIERAMQVRGMAGASGRTGKAWIVNEAHGLTSSQSRKLLTLLEPEGGIPRHVAFIFTTTNEGEEALFEGCLDAKPLLSRCIEVPLARRGLAEAFAKRARAIALAAGLDGKPERAYLELVKSKRNNMRAVLQEIEAGAMIAEGG